MRSLINLGLFVGITGVLFIHSALGQSPAPGTRSVVSVVKQVDVRKGVIEYYEVSPNGTQRAVWDLVYPKPGWSITIDGNRATLDALQKGYQIEIQGTSITALSPDGVKALRAKAQQKAQQDAKNTTDAAIAARKVALGTESPRPTPAPPRSMNPPAFPTPGFGGYPVPQPIFPPPPVAPGFGGPAGPIVVPGPTPGFGFGGGAPGFVPQPGFGFPARPTTPLDPATARQQALGKIAMALALQLIADNQDLEAGPEALLLFGFARIGRSHLIASAVQDAFPKLDGIKQRTITRVLSYFLDGKLQLKRDAAGRFAADTFKDEVIEALKQSDPGLGQTVEVIDFLADLADRIAAQQRRNR